MPRILLSVALAASLALAHAAPALAHFGMIIPSESMVMDKKDNPLVLNIGFAHPFAQHAMNMYRPKKFFVSENGRQTDLTQNLKPVQYLGKNAWQCEYNISRPGVYIFAGVPTPYYEQAEDCFIVHFAKTVVGAYGEESGWDEKLNLPVEIVPLSRPFGNYPGNVFTGQVLRRGKPLPNAIVEVENLNRKGLHKAPNAYFETQTVKTDENGIFTFGIPWAGWWGFAALCESSTKIEMNNEQKAVELGGILWLEFVEPQLSGQGEERP